MMIDTKKLEEIFGLTAKEIGACKSCVDCQYANTINFYAIDSRKFNEDLVQYILAYGYKIRTLFIHDDYTIDQFRIIRKLIRQKKLEQVQLYGNLSHIPYRLINEVMKLKRCDLNNFSHKKYTKLILNNIKDDRFICGVVIKPRTTYLCVETASYLIKNTRIHELHFKYLGSIELIYDSLLSAITNSTIQKLKLVNSKVYKNITNFTINLLNSKPNINYLHISKPNIEELNIIDMNFITNVLIQSIEYQKLIKKEQGMCFYELTKFQINRNIQIQDTITKVICLLFLAGSKPTSIIFSLPPEIIYKIANLIIQSRTDPIWLQGQGDKVSPL